MRFKRIKNEILHFIEEETGIEFFEKDVDERMARFATEGWDTRLTSNITFVFRDPRWAGNDGSGNIEFSAKPLTRTAKETYSDGSSFPYTEVYGFEIPPRPFLDSFKEYVGSDDRKLARLKAFVTDAILTYLGSAQDKRVIFLREA